MNRVLRKIVAAVLVGMLAVVGWLAVSMVVVRMGQTTVEQVSDSPAPPAREFYDADLFGQFAPWLFAMGFFGTLLETRPSRRR